MFLHVCVKASWRPRSADRHAESADDHMRPASQESPRASVIPRVVANAEAVAAEPGTPGVPERGSVGVPAGGTFGSSGLLPPRWHLHGSSYRQ